MIKLQRLISMNIQKIKEFKLFTLVELIVVIVILAVLSMIAIMTISKWIGKSRDTKRESDLSSIQRALTTRLIEYGSLPTPDNITIVNFSGVELWSQGVFGDEVNKILVLFGKKPKDPSNNEYVYSLTADKKKYQIAGLYEGNIAQNNLIDSAYAQKDYTIKMFGNYETSIMSAYTGNKYYLLTVPSLFLSEAKGGSFRYNFSNYLHYILDNQKNFPWNYSGFLTDSTLTGGVRFKNIVLFSGTSFDDLQNVGSPGFSNFHAKLLKAYSGTELENVGYISNYFRYSSGSDELKNIIVAEVKGVNKNTNTNSLTGGTTCSNGTYSDGGNCISKLVMVKEIYTGGASNVYSKYLTKVGNKVFFISPVNSNTNNNQVWKTDGTTSGTIPVTNLTTPSTPTRLISTNSSLYFQNSNGRDVWKIDANTLSSTKMNSVSLGNFGGAVGVLDRLFFLPGMTNRPVWTSDGTTSGTYRLVNMGGSDNGQKHLTNGGNIVFYSNNSKLRRSDGTTGGTYNIGTVTDAITNSKMNLGAVDNNILYFPATDGMRKSDGTTGGTVKLGNSKYYGNWEPIKSGNKIYYVVYDSSGIGVELGVFDLTTNTETLIDINPGSGYSNPERLTAYNGKLYFTASSTYANNAKTNDEIRVSDGTQGGTSLLKDINSTGSSSPSYLTVVNSTLYFVAGTGAGACTQTFMPSCSNSASDCNMCGGSWSIGGLGIWKSDGTTAGTAKLQSLSGSILSPSSNLGSDGPRNQFIYDNNYLYFIYNDNSHGYELWKYKY